MRLSSRSLRPPRQSGQTLAEYTVVLAVITIAIVIAIAYLSASSQGGIGSVASRV